MAPPFKEAEFDILYGKGISKEGDILDLAVEANIVDKSGAWYAYNSAKLGQGREKAKDYLLENPDICKEIELKVRELYALQNSDDLFEREEDEVNSNFKKATKKSKTDKKKAEAVVEETVELPEDEADLFDDME